MNNSICEKCSTETPLDNINCRNCGATLENQDTKNVEYTELVERAIQGDITAFQVLYEKRFNDLYYIALTMLRNPHDAEDATQGAFIKAWRSIANLKSPFAFKGWLVQILRNNCMDLIRKNTPVLSSVEDMNFEETMCEENVEFLPADIMDKKETQRLVREIVNDLPETQRETIILHYFELMPVKDIASIMNVSEGTVKWRLHNGRNTIKGGVENHERVGIKLYSITGLPFITSILRDVALEVGFSPEAIAKLWDTATISIGVGTGVTAGSATGTGLSSSVATVGTVASNSPGLIASITAMSLPVKASVIGGVLTLCILGGIGIASLVNSESNQDPKPLVLNEEESITDDNDMSDIVADIVVEEPIDRTEETFESEEEEVLIETPHPYAQALQEFFDGESLDRIANLSEVQYSDEPIVLAVLGPEGFVQYGYPIESFRLLYLQDGALHIYDSQEIERWPYRHVTISENNYLVEFFGDEGYIEFIIHLFANGDFIPNAVTILSVTDVDSIDLADDWDNWYLYNIYEYNGSTISASEFEKYRKHYGLESIWSTPSRPDDTEKILAMTVFQTVMR